MHIGLIGCYKLMVGRSIIIETTTIANDVVTISQNFTKDMSVSYPDVASILLQNIKTVCWLLLSSN